MKYIKGRVLNIDDQIAQVFTQDGNIVRIKRLSDMKVGQPIICTDKDFVKRPIIKRFRFKTLAMLPLALMFLLVSMYTVSLSQVYAVVSLDINPSLSLSIDKSGGVIGARAYNDDAKELLNNYGDVKGMPITKVIAGLISASDERYITKDNHQIYIVTTALREGMTRDIDVMLEDIIAVASTNTLENTVEIYTALVTSESYTLAMHEDVTIGNYAKAHPEVVVPKIASDKNGLSERENIKAIENANGNANGNANANSVIKGFEKKILIPKKDTRDSSEQMNDEDRKAIQADEENNNRKPQNEDNSKNSNHGNQGRLDDNKKSNDIDNTVKNKQNQGQSEKQVEIQKEEKKEQDANQNEMQEEKQERQKDQKQLEDDQTSSQGKGSKNK